MTTAIETLGKSAEVDLRIAGIIKTIVDDKHADPGVLERLTNTLSDAVDALTPGAPHAK